MSPRTPIAIPSSTFGWNLDAWKFTPDGNTSKKPWPVIVMAHGLSGNRQMGLASYAEAFGVLGYACIVFDYRRWGTSDGTPRRVINVSEQLEDYRTVIKYVRHQVEYDPGRVVLWGTSFSGGHAIKLASEVSFGVLKIFSLINLWIIENLEPELNVHAAIAQIPYTGVLPKTDVTTAYIKTLILAAYDWVKQSLRLAPVYIPTFMRSSSEVGLLILEDKGLEFFASQWHGTGWINEISASTAFELFKYKPAAKASEIRCPLLLVAGLLDTICSVDGIETVSRLAKGSEYVGIQSADHFDFYPGSKYFEESITAQLRFLEQHLN